MRLEVLMPKDWEHELKAILIQWYIRQGYTFTEDEDFAKNYPHIQALMDHKCNLKIYHKSL